MTPPMPPLHLAFPVDDLPSSRAFHGGLLECQEGRSAEQWVDFDSFGHQVVAHVAADEAGAVGSNPVDGHDVPCRHFGVVLPMGRWRSLTDRLEAADTRFVIEPHVRFVGEPGEQATMFFLDPSGNALEFKAFADQTSLFAR